MKHPLDHRENATEHVESRVAATGTENKLTLHTTYTGGGVVSQPIPSDACTSNGTGLWKLSDWLLAEEESERCVMIRSCDAALNE